MPKWLLHVAAGLLAGLLSISAQGVAKAKETAKAEIALVASAKQKWQLQAKFNWPTIVTAIKLAGIEYKRNHLSGNYYSSNHQELLCSAKNQQEYRLSLASIKLVRGQKLSVKLEYQFVVNGIFKEKEYIRELMVPQPQIVPEKDLLKALLLRLLLEQQQQEQKLQQQITAVETRLSKKIETLANSNKQQEQKLQQQITAIVETRLSKKIKELAQAERKRKSVAKRSSDGRYEVSSEGVITDTTTHLQWYVGPNQDTTWDQAAAWVKKLSVSGGGWRLPTLDELQGIYEKNKGSDKAHIDAVFWNKNIPLWVWSNETKGSSSAWNFAFDSGYRHWDDRSDSYNNRGFAVRSGS